MKIYKISTLFAEAIKEKEHSTKKDATTTTEDQDKKQLSELKQKQHELKEAHGAIKKSVDNLFTTTNILGNFPMNSMRLNILTVGIKLPERAQHYVEEVQSTDKRTMAELAFTAEKYHKATNIPANNAAGTGGASKGSDLHYNRLVKNDTVMVEVKATGTAKSNESNVSQSSDSKQEKKDNTPTKANTNKAIMKAEHQHKIRVKNTNVKDPSPWHKTVISISRDNPSVWPFTNKGSADKSFNPLKGNNQEQKEVAMKEIKETAESVFKWNGTEHCA